MKRVHLLQSLEVSMFRTLKEWFSSSLFVSAFFLASNVSFAHFNSIGNKIDLPQNNDFAVKCARDLQNRLGLSNYQTSRVASILLDFKNRVLNNSPDQHSIENSQNPQRTANNRIFGLLDENQKVLFTQMEKEWWTNINTNIDIINDRY